MEEELIYGLDEVTKAGLYIKVTGGWETVGYWEFNPSEVKT